MNCRRYPNCIVALGLALALMLTSLSFATPVAAQQPCGESVTVQPGDTLREIANRCNTTVQALLEVNPNIVNRNLIYVGQVIQIPQADQSPQPAQPSVRAVPDAAPPGATFDVFASGFPANSDLTIGVGPQGQAITTVNVVTGPEGQGETTLTVPETVEPGQQLQVVAYVPEEGGAMAQTTVTVLEPGEEGGDVTVSISPTSGPPGTEVTVDAVGLPANTTIDIGAGPVDSEYDIIAQAQTNAQGELSRVVSIPERAEPGEEWVIALTPAGSPVDYISNTFAVTEPGEDDQNLFTSTNIYLIALEDAGQTGMQVGCGDSVVPVEVQIEPTLGVLRAAMENLVNLEERFYGESGLYNALYRSDLSVDEVTIQDSEAIVRLSGELVTGGVCDAPRVRAQLRQTALQYYTVDSVSIFVNGQPLDEVLSQR